MVHGCYTEGCTTHRLDSDFTLDNIYAVQQLQRGLKVTLACGNSIA